MWKKQRNTYSLNGEKGIVSLMLTYFTSPGTNQANVSEKYRVLLIGTCCAVKRRHCLHNGKTGK